MGKSNLHFSICYAFDAETENVGKGQSLANLEENLIRCKTRTAYIRYFVVCNIVINVLCV